MTFVGREQVLESVEGKLRRIAEIGHSVSNTQVVQGPPGAGKTSLINFLTERYQRSNVVPVCLSGGDLANPVAVASAFVEGCGIDTRVLEHAHETGVSGSLGIKWLNIAAGKTKQTASAIDRLLQGVPLWNVLNNFLQVPKETLFLVLVDEVQRITPNADRRENTIAVQLHDGHTGKFMVLPVFAGLSDTRPRLSDAGISRIPDGAVHVLGALSQEETKAAIHGFLNHASFAFNGAFDESLQRQVSEPLTFASEGYPRHIHCYLQGLARELLQNTGLLDMDHVLEYGHNLRIAYCRDRLQMAKLGDFAKVLIAAAQASEHDEPLSIKSLKERAKKDYAMAEDKIETYVERAIHAGVLEPVGEELDPEMVEFPIPSLHTFVALRGNPDKVLEHMRTTYRRRRHS